MADRTWPRLLLLVVVAVSWGARLADGQLCASAVEEIALGCYNSTSPDGAVDDMEEVARLGPAATLEDCLRYCFDNGLVYAGARGAAPLECRCGSHFGKFGRPHNLTLCDLPCPGGGGQVFCGSDNYTDVYNVFDVRSVLGYFSPCFNYTLRTAAFKAYPHAQFYNASNCLEQPEQWLAAGAAVRDFSGFANNATVSGHVHVEPHPEVDVLGLSFDGDGQVRVAGLDQFAANLDQLTVAAWAEATPLAGFLVLNENAFGGPNFGRGACSVEMLGHRTPPTLDAKRCVISRITGVCTAV